MGGPVIGPFEGNRVYQGECLRLLLQLPSDSMDALVTDPPYCSGADITVEPNKKYLPMGQRKVYPTFGGDSRDAASWQYWSALWLSECYRILKQGAYAMTFCDWRKLPDATNAFQAGGFTWRGVISWDKVNARAPHTGYFKHQCEYIVWGTKGDFREDGPRNGGGPFDGNIRCPVRPGDKFHTTGKPVPVMRHLLSPLGLGALVLDPFAGSGSTILACKETGRIGLGFEQSQEYTDIANGRLT
jgi:site-specific DNA-methyltransferase (adenine-specific)